jgi:hypothetical protein
LKEPTKKNSKNSLDKLDEDIFLCIAITNVWIVQTSNQLPQKNPNNDITKENIFSVIILPQIHHNWQNTLRTNT